MTGAGKPSGALEGLPPSFHSLLDEADAATYMLVRSGTSRILAVYGDQVRRGKAGEAELLRLLLGRDGRGGLGGPTLQDNKVALVWHEDGLARLRFRFLQVIPSNGTVLPMECSNSASAAAMLAQFGGRHRVLEPCWHAENVSTRQRIELRPFGGDRIPESYQVRFLASDRTRRALAGLAGPGVVRVRGRQVAFQPVLLGNLFLFSEIDPNLDAETLDALVGAGMEAARAVGFQPPPGYHPKVIPYRLLDSEAVPTVLTASFYLGERHRSFPGSAAMALCAYLAQRRSATDQARDHWQVRHPSGQIDVRLGFDPSRGGALLRWTEFVTPVSLLAWGRVAMPWRDR